MRLIQKSSSVKMRTGGPPGTSLLSTQIVCVYFAFPANPTVARINVMAMYESRTAFIAVARWRCFLAINMVAWIVSKRYIPRKAAWSIASYPARGSDGRPYRKRHRQEASR